MLLQHYCDVPVSYCWSPTLLPCPSDWPSNAEVVGFCQLEASQRMQYQPPEDLKQFLAAGKPPVYIGFGSMTLSKAKVNPCEPPGLSHLMVAMASQRMQYETLVKVKQSLAAGKPQLYIGLTLSKATVGQPMFTVVVLLPIR